MDLKSGYPFWPIRHGLGAPMPALDGDARCELLILGGGITGALFADRFAREGVDVLLVDQRDVGWGSSAASTALLQYEIDTPMTELAERYGEPLALRAYRACLDAVDEVAARAQALKVESARSASLYLASRRRDLAGMSDEYALRLKHGFAVSWLGPAELRARFGARSPSAILSEAGAWVDPFAMTWALLRSAIKHGARVHDRVQIARMQAHSRGIRAHTASGMSIRADRVVIAAGYESQRWLKQQVAKNRSSYAFATDHDVIAAHPKIKDTMIWESARPYFYLRVTGDGRIIAGGEDDSVDIPARRDALVDAKAKKIARRIAGMLPELALEPAWAWAGTFAETFDGLPFFGSHRQWGPRVFFAMAYGGNGITFSQIGTDLLAATLARRRHPLHDLFSFERLEQRR